jgi:proteic killer suppression protein
MENNNGKKDNLTKFSILSTIESKMTGWTVQLVSEAREELKDAPPQVKRKFDHWVVSVQAFGPWLKGGWRTEALSGVLKGFHSVRLNRQWRAIFEVRAERSVIVIRIVAHDYKAVGRR